MKAVIIAHGSLDNGEELTFECADSDIIICADGGAEYAAEYNIIPDIIIGDLDSIPCNIIEYFKSKDVEIITYPCEKDFTDTEICVYKAKELGCDTICIAAGIGDRIDHSLGNIGLLHVMKEMNVNGYIFNSTCYMYLCRNSMAISGRPGDTISIIPYNGTASGLNSTGLKYQLNNLSIPFGKPLGISNVMTDEKCTISIDKGEILVIKQNNI